MIKFATALAILFTHVNLSADAPCNALANALSHKNIEVRYLKCLMKNKINDCSTRRCATEKQLDCIEYIYKHQLQTFKRLRKRNCFYNNVSFSKVATWFITKAHLNLDKDLLVNWPPSTLD